MSLLFDALHFFQVEGGCFCFVANEIMLTDSFDLNLGKKVRLSCSVISLEINQLYFLALMDCEFS